ncbi:Wadjet anti-phage system protein JetD domain-containing protein [Ralstonia solanacearum]|uniref:Wadjet anti-phage system protein JetD domain-containing protein n=1 Tax=Ralstonia solanacearum TaxID=305 RepID=UPI0018D06DA4|nr:Wadjet anti-phage system protein JetD domain-containing protein [Ralstonia solanacearum]
MNDRAPLWLQSAEVQQLLNLLVDRLDNADQRGTRAQSVALGPKTWPALYEAPFESAKETLWEQLGELVRWGWLAVKPEGVAKVRSGYDRSPRVTVLDEPVLRKAVGRPERVRSPAERWREAVYAGLIASEEVKRQVSEFCIDMPDRVMSEVVARLNELPALKDESLLLREVSSRLFWGMSKVLDKRQGMVAALLELDECPFPESPVQLQVFLPPAGFHGVLFIENLTTYDQAVRSTSAAFDGLALVYASGFKGSAQRLRTPEGCSLFFSDRGGDTRDLRDGFKAWLFGKSTQPAHFWGDLDWSGLRILVAMRSSFPGLTAWQLGYGPMLLALLAGQGHSPDAAEKQGQRALSDTGCAYTDGHLVPALRETSRFVDQELFKL